MHISRFHSAFSLVIVLLSLLLVSWGAIGHRVVGDIAENHLSRKARKNVKRVLGNESLARVSTWMDDIKSDENYKHTYDWHWVTIPDEQKYVDTEKNPDGDVIQTIKRLTEELRDGGLDESTEKEHLMMLVHLVGDIHQPLHVGTGKDLGGNQVRVKWFGRNSNLHRVWDSDVIDSFQLSYTEISGILDHPTKEQLTDWQESSVEDWAYEAMALREQVYEIGDGDLGYQFRYRNKDLIEMQMLKAGVRLAGLINSIYN